MWLCWGVCAATAAQAAAGAVSTVADVEVENAGNQQETTNLLLDMSELLIEAYAAGQQY